MKSKKDILIIISTIFMIVCIVILGPMDIFTHGYFSDEIALDQITTEDYLDSVNLADEDYTMSFSPQKDHMTGIEIYLINQPEGNNGNLNLSIFDDTDKIIDSIDVDLGKVTAASWYKVYTSADLKKGIIYTLKFSVRGSCDCIPWLQNVDGDYLPNETITGNILLSYAYEKSTFTFQNKVIISLFIIANWMFIVSCLISEKNKKKIQLAMCFLLITAGLTWNYMYNSMDNQNTSFSGFQADSETLAAGVIYAEEDGEYFRIVSEQGFGLGRYYDLKGSLYGYGLSYITNDNWLEGFSRNENSIVVNSNPYSKEVAVAGNQIRFKNGDVYQITAIEDNGTNIVIYLNSGKLLSPAKCGSLDDATFLNANGDPLHKSLITAYKSQYGLQGKVFRHLSRYMDDEQELATLNLVCSLAAAAVFATIVIMLAMKYNSILAGCFLITFWLSPWIVNFARNLYWVEFTWFIPMAIGLLCSWKIDDRKYRAACYFATYSAITGKCLCGYEYISVIMMSLISFMIVDFFCSALNKDKKKSLLIFRTIVIVGIIALAGFMTAICIHAPLKGDGSIVDGIINIFEQDVLKRTNGADLNDFGEQYWPSFNASVWEVYSQYFHFRTEIITGITGNLFPLLCVVPLFIFGYEFKKKDMSHEWIVMYIIFFLTSISWFCLAKSHSYIHPHMNYVLWYFGFVQICFYIIINKLVNCFLPYYRRRSR